MVDRSSFFNGAQFTNYANMPSAGAFDQGRFGDPAFDQGRFGTATPSPSGLLGLQQGLRQQALDNGYLPSLPQGQTVNPAPAVMSYAPEEAAPAMGLAQVNSMAQGRMGGSPVAGGLLGQQDYARQQQIADKTASDMKARGLLGTLGGAILGGSLLGPVGGLLGGYAGRSLANTGYYPEAPTNFSGENKGYGYNDLGSAGRDTYNDSGQFRDAVDSGKGGLW